MANGLEWRGWRRGVVLAGALAAGLAALPGQQAAAADPDTLTVAIGAEPETMLPRAACSTSADYVTDTVYERLTRQKPDGTLGGWLAESFKQLDSLNWEFKLRHDVTFSDGEPFNADAVVTTVNYYTDAKNPSQCLSGFSTLVGAKKVDDYTVDLTTKTPDLTLPARLLQLYILAPKWVTSTPDTQAATQAVGTGPYTLAEWVKGDHLTLKANPTYWGDPKPSFGTVRLVARPEAQVRADMVKAGEADLALDISQAQAAPLPKSVTAETTESVLIRLNTQQKFLSDIRVRQAINMSIDRATIMKALYPGVTSSLNGQAVRSSAFGYNPSLTDYPFDAAKAAELIKAAGATGQNLNLVVRNDLLPNVNELSEALQGMIQQSGLKVTLQLVDAAVWRQALWANGPGQARSDMHMDSASDIQFDSSRVLDLYFGTGVYSQSGDAAFQSKIAHADAATGDERKKEYQAVWQEIHDNNWFVPIFGLDYIHGLSARVNWTPRPDGFLLYNTVSKAD